MAEQSVQGRIHSVFWEKLPHPLAGHRLATEGFGKGLHKPRPMPWVARRSSPPPCVFPLIQACLASFWLCFRTASAI